MHRFIIMNMAVSALMILLCLSWTIEAFHCPDQDTAFELRTGFVFTAPEDILDTRSVFLLLLLL